MILVQLLIIAFFTITCAVTGVLLIRIMWQLWGTDEEARAWIMGTIGTMCLSFTVYAGVTFYEPLINEIGSLL